jgi:hypothetical protein
MPYLMVARDGGTAIGVPTGGQLQKGLRRLSGQMVHQRQEGVFVGLPHVVQPLRRYAVSEERLGGDVGKQRHCGSGRIFGLPVCGNDDFLDPLPNLHQLGGPGLRMGFQFPPFGPVVGVVVMADVTQKKAFVRPMNDQPKIAADPHRPEMLVLGLVQLVELHTRTGRVQLLAV